MENQSTEKTSKVNSPRKSTKERMQEWDWVNPYVELIDSKPELLLGTKHTSQPDDELRARLAERMSQYSEVYCDFGSGSGGFLLGHAAKRPDTLFLGCELRYKRAFRTAEKAEREGLRNIFVVHGEILKLCELLPERSLNGIYVNFPDPWEKKKWQKHRLMTADFLAITHKLLKDKGSFEFKSDHTEYFASVVDVFKNSSLYELKGVTNDLEQSEFSKDNVHTEFELLFRSKGVPANYLKAVRA